MGRRPTIIDVAEKAGVSKSTVSLVLRQSPAVHEETRAQVRAAMAELGYVYNRTAATMRSANAGLIGLVINDLRNPFFTEFATAVQMTLAERGYAAVMANTDERGDLQTEVIGAMIEHGVSALIVSSAYGADGAAFDAIGRAGIPAMQVLRRAEARTRLLPFAAPDYGAGGRLATEHLLAAGARRIAFIGGLEGREVTQERMSGYLATLRSRGLPTLALPGRASRAFGRDMAETLRRDHPEIDAVLCFNDLIALGMLSGCAEIGREIGSNFRVVGFDDIEECAQSYPALTTVRCDIAGFGGMVARTVLQWLEEGVMPQPETRTPVELRIRASSGGRA